MTKEYIKGPQAEERGYSRAVKVRGGTTIYVAGIAGATDEKGRTLSGDFEGQVHAAFENIRKVLEQAGGTLDDVVATTVFIKDIKYGRLFQQMRNEYFPHKDGYPTSALIGINELGSPELLVEIQAIAVIDD